MKSLNIILLGRSGSGKGTQAELLQEKYFLINIDSKTRDSISLLVSITSIESIRGIICLILGLSYRLDEKYDLTLFFKLVAFPIYRISFSLSKNL